MPVRLQLEHLPGRFSGRVLNLSTVPAAFVRPREDGQAVTVTGTNTSGEGDGDVKTSSENPDDL